MACLKRFNHKKIRVFFTAVLFMWVCLYIADVSGSFKTVEIIEGRPSGSIILHLQKKSGIEYILHKDSSTGDIDSLFRISPDGVLSLEAALDFEDQRGSEFDVVIIAREIGRTEGGEAMVIHVKVLDRNDHAPRFTKDLYSAFVRENTQIGSCLSGLENVFAEDLDSGVNSLESYKIIAGNKDGKFRVEFNEIEGVKFLQIKTTGEIDREKDSFYVLTVQAVDGGNPPLSSTTQVRVNVLDENDCLPEFDPPSFSVSVKENAPVGTSILQLKAVDKDVGRNAEIYYRIQRANDYFTINSHTGVVEVAKTLNFEQGSSHDLSVYAIDRGINSRQTSTLVRVRIVDVMGFPPVLQKAHESTKPRFETEAYYVKIREDFPPGGYIIRVDALRQGNYPDALVSDTIEYSLGDKRHVFKINPNNGLISLIKRLNYDIKYSYRLRVKAKLIKEPYERSFVTETEVIIDVEKVDVNSFNPVFNSSSMVVRVSENTLPGTKITQVSATDTDSGSNGRVQYFFTGGTGLGKFKIHKNSGAIKLLANVANFKEQSFDLYISATDRGKIPRHSTIYVIVKIVGEARKRPFFFLPTQVVQISENLPRKSFVALVRAWNRNRFHAPLEYRISAGNPEGDFLIDPSSGIIHTTRALDREKVARYMLDVQAKVKGDESSMSSTVQVVVMVTDVNDNAPFFGRKEYTVSLMENQGFTANLLCLAASDRDTGVNGDVSYAIVSGNEAGLFSIDSNKGIVSSKSLDYEKEQIHRLTVRASDHGDPCRSTDTTVRVLVRDANDAPQLSKDAYEVTLKESTQYGIVAFINAFDEDSIADVEVPEGSELRTTLIEFGVSDKDRGSNGEFSCSMEDVDVEEAMGFKLFTKAKGCALILVEYLDYSKRKEYRFKVRVTDHAAPAVKKSAVAMVTVKVVDENNNAPMFGRSSYWIAKAEYIPGDNSIIKINAEDLDAGYNAVVRYSATSPLFNISGMDGIVYSKQQLVQRSKPYEVTVKATDKGKPSMSSEVKLYVSVHPVDARKPMFKNSAYRITVAENIRKGSKLVTVAIVDGYKVDIKSVRFSIVGGDRKNKFSIDTTTGVVSLRKSLDYEEVKSYELIVRATQSHVDPNVPDLPNEVSLFVKVTNVNDNKPRFATAQDPVEVIIAQVQHGKDFGRDTIPALFVTKLTAYDKDLDAVSYELEPGNDDFDIDADTGDITTVKDLTRPSYTFVVTASDGKLKGIANVRVFVNILPPAPTFAGSLHRKIISETVQAGTSVMTLQPINSDNATLHYSIENGNYGDVLCIDVTGVLRIVRPLDREKVAEYELNVNVNLRRGVNSSVRIVVPDVLVTVSDANDNAPVFGQQSYKFYASENVVRAGDVIGMLSARDPDDGDNGMLAYSIVGTEDVGSDGMFEIKGTNLVIGGASMIDRETMPHHTLTVRATDGGRPSFSCLTQVVIIILDENDHDPQFVVPSYRATIPFNAPPDYSVVKLLATDLDRGHNGIIRYLIAQSSPPDVFVLHPTDGSLTLRKRITTLKPIRVKVLARDRGMPSRNTSVRVSVHVQATGGPPQFLRSPLIGHALENKAVGVTAATAVAASVDPVTYKIVTGNEAGNFKIHPGNGEIQTTRTLDREENPRYEFIVMATDVKGRLSESNVTVLVGNENDNRPEFVNTVEGVIEGQIPLDAARGSRVMQLEARDKDGDTLSFSIQEAPARSYFTIDKSGLVRSRALLHKLKNPFTFTVDVSDNGEPPLTSSATARLVLLKYQMNQRDHTATVREDAELRSLVTTVNSATRIQNARFSIVSPRETPFSINSRNGSIHVKQKLDYESKKSHNLIVQVSNEKQPKDYTNVFVVIEVTDANDNSPKFTMERVNGRFVAMMNSHTREKTAVYKLSAKDADSGLNGEVRFSIIFGARGRFEIDKRTGKDIILKGSSYLPFPWYNLTVRSSDKGVPPRSSDATVYIRVGDYPPRFNSTEYVFTVDENTQRGHSIGVLGASSFSGASLKFEIVQGVQPSLTISATVGNSQKKFLLDSITGRLTLPHPLDFESDAHAYYLRVRGSEVATTKSFSSEVNVKVVLLDVNDNAPEFLQPRYVDTLPESAPIGMKILSVSAVDKDSGIKGQFRFWLDNPFFAVDPYLGILTTRKQLDYEEKVVHTFTVVAQDSGERPLRGSARIVIRLTNMNDNAPKFSQSIYNVFVAEDAEPGEMVATVQAGDADLDPVTYSISSGDKTGSFVIDSKTGVIQQTSHRTPSLIGPYYTLNISASDGYHVSEAIVVVAVQDVNNYKPVFTECDSYRPVVTEHRPPGTFVFKVTAEDKDMDANGEIEYKIERGEDAPKLFEINSRTGEVHTMMEFDREHKQMYQILITGMDGGANASMSERLMGFCQVEIEIADINDHAPVFDIRNYYVPSIHENAPVGTSVLQVSARDNDWGTNALISYSLKEKNQYFAIDNSTGIIKTRSQLQRSGKPLRLTVLARDNGKPPLFSQVTVSLTVLSVGNDPPKFTQSVYVKHIRENQRIASHIITVKATSSRPGKISYIIEDGNLPSTNNPRLFDVGLRSGRVWTRGILDYETTPNFTLKIRASVGYPKLISFATLKIFLEDVNDSPPDFIFREYKSQVKENSPIGTPVLSVKAIDRDSNENGRVTYHFESDQLYFKLDKHSGLITTGRVFDREKRSHYILSVVAQDQGSPPVSSTCEVLLRISDENDNAPVFDESSYNVSVYEDELVGTELLRVLATDKDIGVNARINYHITDGNKGAVFAISANGKITVASHLDRETKDSYTLRISALDGKNSGNTVVYATVEDVNDNNPSFDESSYKATLLENAPTDTTVITLSASDVDLGMGGQFVYSISGQGLSAFKIDPVTGVITTRRPLDREKKARYEFLAFATDGPGEKNKAKRTGSCDVIIRIRDINDNQPEFPDEPYFGNVRENLPPGASVLVMSAVDKDDPNENGNAVMTYQLVSSAGGLFVINSTSGLISTTAKLDRERVDQYSVVVKATDHGKPQRTGQVSVLIRVTDDNDQRPRFVQRVFHANISENAAIKTSVLVLRAVDKDTGSNAKLRYKILQRRKHKTFDLVEDTGVLRVAHRLDYESRKKYHFRVEVRDQGTPSFKDRASVVVHVEDHNDNPPMFHPLSYTYTVSENVTVGTSLLRVNASDRDTGRNKEFRFSVAGGDLRKLFRINSTTGELFVAKPLDREETAIHDLTIRATNLGAPSMYGEATVRIHLTDINDNGPRFNPSEYHVYVTENVSPPVAIGKLTVDDPDERSNGPPFLFGIQGDSANQLFSVHNRTGILETKVEFDREKKAKYSFTIWARDSGNPPQTSTATVHVHIRDVNDNPHSAGALELTLNTLQGNFGGGAVGKVYVVDKDTDDERLYTVEEASSEYFDVDHYTGAIRSQPEVPEGVYRLKVQVADRHPDSKNRPVLSTVKITVKQIPTEAVDKSIAVRLKGISRESFLIILPEFKDAVSDFLSTKVENVKLFSIQDATAGGPAIDVRFAAHGSPYYSPERMVATLKAQRPKLQEVLPAHVDAIGVDECAREPCETGSCRNNLSYDGKVEAIEFDGKSFASLKTSLTAVCDSCRPRDRSLNKCKPGLCLNGGTCRESPTGHACECPAGLQGDNCELTTRSFKPGEWAWFPPLRQCRDSLLSMEFATKGASGLLLYNGPTSPLDGNDLQDFISVALVDGNLRVSMSIGDAGDIVSVGLSDAGDLSDGAWHLVEVRRNRTEVTVTVDNCRLSSIVEKESGERSEDRSRCEAKARFKRDTFAVLNPPGPVHLGGISNRELMYPQNLKVKDFNGCIRNVVNDGTLYDLKSPSDKKGSAEGCRAMDKHCLPQSPCYGRAKCVPSWTGYSCLCPMGFRGDTCREETRPYSYDEGSYTKYHFTDKFLYSPRETSIEMQVRTRDKDGGVLMYSSGTLQSEYSLLEIKPAKTGVNLVYSYNVGGDLNHVVTLGGVNITDGKWHSVVVTRQGTKVVLKSDMEGFWYKAKGEGGGTHTLLNLHPSATYVGGLPKSVNSRRRRDVTDDFVGCINDVRLNGHPLYSAGSTEIAQATSTGVTEGCESTVCDAARCSDTRWCHDQWRVYSCLPRLCASRPCFNGGTCIEGVDSKGMNMFHCKCTPAFQGPLCDTGRAVVSPNPEELWNGGLAIGLSVVVAVAMFAVCFIVVFFKRVRKPKRGELNLDENEFRRDNVIDYCIEGGGEEDLAGGAGVCKNFLSDVDGASQACDRESQAQVRGRMFKGYAYHVTGPDDGANYIELPYYNGVMGKPRAKSKVTINPAKHKKRDKYLPCKVTCSSCDGRYRPQTPSGHFEQQCCTSDGNGKGNEDGNKRKGLGTVIEESENINPRGPVLVKFAGDDHVVDEERSPRSSIRSPIGSDRDSFLTAGEGDGCASAPPSPFNWMRAEMMSTGDSGYSETELSPSRDGKNAAVNEDKLAPPSLQSPCDREQTSPESMDSGHPTLSSPDSPCYYSADEGLVLQEPVVPYIEALRKKMAEESDSESDDLPPPPTCCEEKPEPLFVGGNVVCKPGAAPSPLDKICFEKKATAPAGDRSNPDEESQLKKKTPEFSDVHQLSEASDKIGPTAHAPAQFCNPKYEDLPPNDVKGESAGCPPQRQIETNISSFQPKTAPRPNFTVNPLYDVPAAYNFLPSDVIEHYSHEGTGSPTISLSSIGSHSSSDDAVELEKMNGLGEKFRKLAKNYGKKPHVSFSPDNEIIKD